MRLLFVQDTDPRAVRDATMNSPNRGPGLRELRVTHIPTELRQR